MSRTQRYTNLAAVVLPLLAFVVAVVLLWNKVVGWHDLVLLAALYVLTGLGITVGFHRMLTHRAFQTSKTVERIFAVLGFALSGGSIKGALTGLLWGGFVRIFLLHHVTWSINSICHFFGTRRFDVDDHSTNVFWLALPSFGEAWHHNHHTFPRSAEHGLKRWEKAMDLSATVIWVMEKCGLVWNVVRITPERQREKTARRAETRTPMA